MKNRFHSVIIIILLVVLAGCENENKFPRCLDAANFDSLHTISINAHVDQGNPGKLKSNDGESTADFSPNQVHRWAMTDFVTTGEPLIIRTRGQWTSWAKNGTRYTLQAGLAAANASNPDDVKEEDLQKSSINPEFVCGPYAHRDPYLPGCHNLCAFIADGYPVTNPKIGAYGPPCWFTNGYGGYLLLAKSASAHAPADPDPNETMEIMRNPKSVVVHLAFKDVNEGGNGLFDSIDTPIYDQNCNKVELKPGWRIYAKILDRYYWDNAGGYSVEFISGAKDASKILIFEYVRKLFKEIIIDNGGKFIYQNLVQKEDFARALHALIALYLTISAIMFVIGALQVSVTDLIIRVLKVGLLLAMIGPNSWDFFYNNLFKIFVDGTEQLVSLVNAHLGYYDKDAPFGFMDYLLQERLFSASVWSIKIRALLSADFAGLVVVIVLIFTGVVYGFLCCYGFVIYMNSMLGIAFLIGLAPITFCGILFERTKSMFEAWITQNVSFMLQTVFIFALISLYSSLILDAFYRALGFTACFNDWLVVDVSIGSITLMHATYKSWTPGQEYRPYTFGTQGMDIKQNGGDSTARYTFTGGGGIIKVPPLYQDKDFRYVDYPYYDPDVNSNDFVGAIRVDVTKAAKEQELVRLNNVLHTLNGKLSILRMIEDMLNMLDQLRNNNPDISKSDLDVMYDTIANSRTNKIDAQGNGDYIGLRDDAYDIILKKMTQYLAKPLQASDASDQRDAQAIKDIIAGNLVSVPAMLNLFLFVFLLVLLYEQVMHIGQAISGSHSAALSSAFAGMFNPNGSGIGAFVGRVVHGFKTMPQDAIGGAPTKLAMYASRAIGNKTKGTAIGLIGRAGIKVFSHLTGSGFTDQKGYKKAMSGLHAAQLQLGYQLKSISPKSAAAFAAKHIMNKSPGGESLIQAVKRKRAVDLERIRNKVIGPKILHKQEKKRQKDAALTSRQIAATNDALGIGQARPNTLDTNAMQYLKNLRHGADGQLQIGDSQSELLKAATARDELVRQVRYAANPAELEQANVALAELDDALRQKLGADFEQFINPDREDAQERAGVGEPRNLDTVHAEFDDGSQHDPLDGVPYSESIGYDDDETHVKTPIDGYQAHAEQDVAHDQVQTMDRTHAPTHLADTGSTDHLAESVSGQEKTQTSIHQEPVHQVQLKGHKHVQPKTPTIDTSKLDQATSHAELDQATSHADTPPQSPNWYDDPSHPQGQKPPTGTQYTDSWATPDNKGWQPESPTSSFIDDTRGKSSIFDVQDTTDVATSWKMPKDVQTEKSPATGKQATPQEQQESKDSWQQMAEERTEKTATRKTALSDETLASIRLQIKEQRKQLTKMKKNLKVDDPNLAKEIKDLEEKIATLEATLNRHDM